MDNEMKKYENKLSTNGYKLTLQRRDIISVLLENKDKHFSADELFTEVKKINKDVGLATIYRSLELFCKLRITRQLDFDSPYKYYEIKIEGDHHHHFICVECGKIIEFDDKMMGKFEKSLEKEYNFKILDHRIKFYGLCNECEKKLKGD